MIFKMEIYQMVWQPGFEEYKTDKGIYTFPLPLLNIAGGVMFTIWDSLIMGIALLLFVEYILQYLSGY